MEIFTERINEILHNESVKQTELANSLGIARQCITDYKSGKSFPTIQTLSALCRTLDISADYLLGLADDFGARASVPISENYSSEEKKLIEDYRELNYYGQKLVKQTIETLRTASAQSGQNK